MLLLFLRFLSCVAMASVGVVYANEQATTANSSRVLAFSATAVITVKADRLQLKNQNKEFHQALYSGNVLVQQASLVIRADSLKIHSKGSKIQKIVAEGKPVFIDNKTLKESISAQANQINYDINSGWLELSGGEPKIVHNGNRINGREIRYNVLSQDVEALGYKDKPAVLIIDPTK